MKLLLSLVAAVLILVALFFAFNSYIYNEKQEDRPQEEKTETSKKPVDAPQTYTASDFTWKVEPSSRYEETMPWHNLSLVVGGRTHFVGESLGCGIIVSGDPMQENELSRHRCWFGGGGEDFSVFFENGAYIVKKRWIQESGGPEVNAPPYGPFETVLMIN